VASINAAALSEATSAQETAQEMEQETEQETGRDTELEVLLMTRTNRTLQSSAHAKPIPSGPAKA
jgi:hypothetical protein